MTTQEDPRALRIQEILGQSLEAAEIVPTDNSNHILHLTHDSLDLKFKIPGLSEISWTALMFESAAALEACCGGPCKLSIVEELGTENWDWQRVNSVSVGLVYSTKHSELEEAQVVLKIIGEFALNGDGVEVVEYYLCLNNLHYQATLTCVGESLKILVGSETFAELKMALNFGELKLSAKQAKRLRSGAVLICPRPASHNVLLSVGNSRYAVGEACWMDSGVRVEIAAKY